MPTLKIVDALAVLDIQPDDLQFFTSLDEEFSFIKKKFHAAARTSHPGKKVAHFTLFQHLPFILLRSISRNVSVLNLCLTLCLTLFFAAFVFVFVFVCMLCSCFRVTFRFLVLLPCCADVVP